MLSAKCGELQPGGMSIPADSLSGVDKLVPWERTLRLGDSGSEGSPSTDINEREPMGFKVRSSAWLMARSTNVSRSPGW